MHKGHTTERSASPKAWAWRMGIGTLVATTLFLVVILSRVDWNPLHLAQVGTRFSEMDPQGTTGYDGQFFYFIARDWAEAVPFIDGPSLRYMRILYPALARILALGKPEWVPWTLILVNLLAHSSGTALITYLIGRRGGAPWYGLVYATWIGALFALRLDLSEPLCFALSLAAIVAYEHDSTVWTLLLLILATLSKELGLVFAGGLALHAALGDRRWLRVFLIGCVPLVTFAGWLLLMRHWLGEFPTRYPAAKLHLPLYGWLSIEDPTVRFFTGIWLALPAIALILLAVAYTVHKRKISLSTALLLAGAGFVLVMPDVSWEDPVAAYRVGMPLIITGLLFLAHHHPSSLRFAAALWMPALLIIFLVPGLI